MKAIVVLLILHQLSLYQAEEIYKIFPIKARAGEDDGSRNDSILEVFQNCRCVIYYQCDDNNNIITDGTTLIDIRSNSDADKISCSKDLYFCCREPSSAITNPVTSSTVAEVSTTSTTLAPDVRTPEIVTEKGTNQQLYVNKDKKKLHCGKQRTLIDMRIYAQKEDAYSTIPGEVPWIVRVFQRSYDGKYNFKCAGTLIHPQVVLTATHCIKSAKAENIMVSGGGGNEFKDIGSDSNIERRADKLIKHPDYYSGGLYNDIGLIILSEPYNLTAYPINTICMANDDDHFEAERCWTAGWGGNERGPTHVTVSKLLKKVEMPLIPFNQCQDLLRKTRLGPEFELHESFVCAGGEEGRGNCDGDGGGPLVCLKNDRYHQIGIVSWGIGCRKANHPEVYTDVRKFKDWIEQNLKQLYFI